MAIARLESAALVEPRVGHKTALFATVDVLAILSGFLIALGLLEIRPNFAATLQLVPARIAIDLAIAVGLVLFFRSSGHYTERRSFWQELAEILLAFGAALLVDAAAMFFMKLEPSRLSVLAFWTVGCAVLITSRWLVKSWLVTRGSWSLPAVIVGTGQNARDLALALLDDPLPTFRPVAFIDPFSASPPTGTLPIERDQTLPVLGAAYDPFEIVRRFPRAHVLVALELDEFPEAKPFVERLSRAHGDVELMLPFRSLPARRYYRTHWVNHDITTIRLVPSLASRSQHYIKRVFDLVVASMILVLLGPLFLLLCACVAASGRPIFFAHTRIGRHGRPFKCLKFRTMVPDAERQLAAILERDPRAAAEWQLNRKLKDDPRVTRIGRFLRRTSLDELPQLINVIKGEMSLVGPRPVTAEEVAAYGEHRDCYLQSRPGITGLWQVSGRNQLDFRRRVHLDAFYVQNWSLLRDIVILLMTVRVVFSRRGAY
ncbi:MAG: undecaprenyl-phosphate galactose phosphotransferase WbaP [Geminicoccaceae bacterium]|nr:undecaprenyl-phosphate galactose phosphotransferase WbaP [Geminicoccaceae bacterium]